MSGQKTSSIWQNFTVVDSNFATCDICKRKLSYKTSVTNLKKHLTKAHLIYSNVSQVKKIIIKIYKNHTHF